MVGTRFEIFVRTADGCEFKAFTWTRDADAGIARAVREGAEFGHTIVEAWAVPVADAAAIVARMDDVSRRAQAREVAQMRAQN